MHTVITVLPQQRVLEIRVEGLPIHTDPDRTMISEVTTALRWVNSILLLGTNGRPFYALLGAGMGDVEDAEVVTRQQL